MASKESIQRRAQRVRRQIKKVAGERPRLSVHRTSKNCLLYTSPSPRDS